MKRISKLAMWILAIALVFALAGCNAISSFIDEITGKAQQSGESTGQDGEETSVLAMPAIRLDGTTLRWNNVVGADRYRVKFTDAAGEPQERLVFTNYFDLAELELPAGEYRFVVKAEAMSSNYVDSAYTPDEDAVVYTVTAAVSLEDMSVAFYRVDEGRLLVVWSKVEGADVYHVQIDNESADSQSNFAVLAVPVDQNQYVIVSVSGKPGYPYDGLTKEINYTASSAEPISTVEYDKKDADFDSGITGAQTVVWDGVSLSPTIAGTLVLSQSFMREQAVGYHDLQATTASGEEHLLVYVRDTRPLAFVNGSGVVIDELDYMLSQGGMTVYMQQYENAVQWVQIDGETLGEEDCALYEGRLVVSLGYISALGEGEYALCVGYVDSLGEAKTATLTVRVTEPSALRYDVATGQSLLIKGLPSGVSAVLGGGIGTEDYTLSTGSVSFDADYLASLSAGCYDYWLQGPSGQLLSLEIYNSASAPYGVLLSYDDHPTLAYGKYRCDCGSDAHSYSLDGGDYTSLSGGEVALGALNKSATHTFSVRCDTNNKTTTYKVVPDSQATAYMSTRYGFEGRNPDFYIGSVDEFCDVVRFLAYGGNVDYARGAFGEAELSVYIGNDVMSKSGDLNAALNALLAEARTRYSSPFDCSISASGGAFDSTARTGVLTITLTFASAIAKTHVNGIERDEYLDSRALLVAGEADRTTYIEKLTRTEQVGNVQELADLPLGVKPVFGTTDDAATAAKAAYNAALEVCKTYIRDGMSDTRKCQVFYDYLSSAVTYDYYALVWYEIGNYRNYLEQDIYAQWRQQSASFAKSCSDEERNAINSTYGYLAAAALARANAAARGTSFWTTWAQNFDDYEAQALDNLRTYARNEVTNRHYSGTALDDDVETMCAQSDYADTVEVLLEMVASSAFDVYGALCGKVSVCDGIADAFRVLCLVEGIECVKVAGQGVNSTGSSEAHAWNKVKVGGVWYCVDATWSNAASCTTHRYFMVPDSTIAADHHEETDGTEAIETLALANEYDYYRNTEVHGYSLYVDTLSQFDTTLRALYNAGERTIELYVAACPSKADFEYALQSAVNKLHKFGSISYVYTYTDGYVVVRF